jgi:hypothetical protein
VCLNTECTTQPEKNRCTFKDSWRESPEITHRDILYCRVLHFGSLLPIYPNETVEHVLKFMLVSDYLSKFWPSMTVVSNKTVYTISVHLCMFLYISLAPMNWADYISKGRINQSTQEMVTRKYETRIKDQPQDLLHFHSLECSVYRTV